MQIDHDNLKQIAESIDDVRFTINVMLISLFGGIVRTIVSENKRNFTAFMLSLIVAGFVGYISAEALKSFELNPAMIGAVVGVVSFSATDILRGIMKITADFSDNPTKCIKEILALWKNK